MLGTSTCATAYIKIFLTMSGLPEEQLLAGTRLTRAQLDRLEYINLADHIAIMNNLDHHSDDRAWSVHLGSQIHITSHGPLGFAAMSAPTLGEALMVMMDYHTIRTDSFHGCMRQEGEYWQFECQDLSGSEPYGRRLTESVIRILQLLIETVLGHATGEHLKICFRYDQPSHHRELEQAYGCSCYYQQRFNGFRFPKTWWPLPSPLYDENSYRQNLANCQTLLARKTRGNSPAEAVRNILSAHFEQTMINAPASNIPNLEQIAGQINISTRTLIRHLKKEQTSYKKLLEELRQHFALQLLRKTGLTVSEISFRLGYHEPANFGRAFRAWFATTPAAWRRALNTGD
ncbi:AraC family transcriptional regulator [Parendozoicomonas haliclonae]|uniref:HTH-type transcriptional regulator GadX n=2 Tax=Parendozoicomonas haliclonae TaxID=1960125 RepID=A0A1X7AM68_9GAMM|nr:AraC family transcriptional regulator [Parendozoicomonas haliclonae]SMA49042.1 HTH-type transcriptional regulator GadX [Parendozoicomonas haliclonae]